MQRKGNFGLPDMVKESPRVKTEIVNLPTLSIARSTFQPGWNWSKDMKPVAGTASCQAHHIFVLLSGQFTTILNDGTEIAMVPGDVADIPPGHDARVVGDQPVVMLDYSPKEL